MSSILPLRLVERALPIMLIANVPVWLFGAFGLAMALEYDHWDVYTYLSLALFSYLPIGVVAGVLANVITLSDRVRMLVIHVLVLWGTLTVALAVVWGGSIWIP